MNANAVVIQFSVSGVMNKIEEEVGIWTKKSEFNLYSISEI